MYVQPPTTQNGVYGSVCEYAVVCQPDPAGDDMCGPPFPPRSQPTWGVRPEAAAQYGLEPIRGDDAGGAVIRTTDGGNAELRLRTIGDDGRRLRFGTRVRGYGGGGGRRGRLARTIDGAVQHKVVGDVAAFSFTFVY